MFNRILERFNKIKHNINTIKKVGKGTMIFCPFCKSPCVSHGKAKVKQSNGLHIEEYSLYCENCKSIAVSTEYWSKTN